MSTAEEENKSTRGCHRPDGDDDRAPTGLVAEPGPDSTLLVVDGSHRAAFLSDLGPGSVRVDVVCVSQPLPRNRFQRRVNMSSERPEASDNGQS